MLNRTATGTSLSSLWLTPPRRASGLHAALAGVLLVAACAPAARPAGEGTGAPSAHAVPKRLTVAMNDEPAVLFSPLGTLTRRVTELRQSVHSFLAIYDHRGDLHPMLAAELPTTANGGWVVRADGSMQTTYRLRPNITWHDGTPLTTRDFVFAWTFMRDNDVANAERGVSVLIDRIDVVDDMTMVFHWPNLYNQANAIAKEDLGPLPTHILETPYRTNKEQIPNLTFWNRDFVGVGPFRVGEWEPGSHLVLQRYEPYFAGPAKLETITVRFIPNEDTLVANLLAGSVDGVLGGITFDQAQFVRKQWEDAGRKPLTAVTATNWRSLSVQFRPDVISPREITDARVRRGLAHAIDREALANVMMGGLSPVADTFILPDDVKWAWVQDGVARYPYDLRRAQQLLAEVGWQRSAQGQLVTASGEQVTVPLWSTGAGAVEEHLVVADNWKAAGVNVQQYTMSPGESRDNRLRVMFPAFSTYSPPLEIRSIMDAVRGPSCTAEENRWTGSNRGCYQNPSLDRVIEAMTVAIDEADQRRAYRDLTRIYSEELPILPLYFSMGIYLFRDGVQGVKGNSRPRISPTWDIADWDVVS